MFPTVFGHLGLNFTVNCSMLLAHVQIMVMCASPGAHITAWHEISANECMVAVYMCIMETDYRVSLYEHGLKFGHKDSVLQTLSDKFCFAL